MIKASFYLDEQNVVRAFDLNGHAEYGQAGSDIVCAGASAISQTVIGTLDELLGELSNYSIDPDSGRIYLEIDDFNRYDRDRQVAIASLMYSALVGCWQMEASYGDYIEVEISEYSEVHHD